MPMPLAHSNARFERTLVAFQLSRVHLCIQWIQNKRQKQDALNLQNTLAYQNHGIVDLPIFVDMTQFFKTNFDNLFSLYDIVYAYELKITR